jgi:hypothetical protein
MNDQAIFLGHEHDPQNDRPLNLIPWKNENRMANCARTSASAARFQSLRFPTHRGSCSDGLSIPPPGSLRPFSNSHRASFYSLFLRFPMIASCASPRSKSGRTSAPRLPQPWQTKRRSRSDSLILSGQGSPSRAT